MNAFATNIASPNNGLTYDEFMAEIDALCLSSIGASIHDLPDWPFGEQMEEHFTPQQTFEFFLEEMADELGMEFAG